MRYLVLSLLLALSPQGCASTGSGPGGSRNIITRAQIEQSQAITAHDVIRALHPQWLRARGQTVGLANATPVTPTVFMDGTRMGDINVLNAYQVRDIQEIHYLDPGRAASRYGMGYPRGIIEIIVSGGVGRDGIPALVNPSLVPSDHAEATYVREADRVVGIEADGRFIAVPHNILWWHEIVNFDDFGSPFAVTYCPLTGSSMVFDRSSIDGVDLGVSGLLFHNNLMMFNRRPDGVGESLFPQMMQGARCGPLDGQPLEPLPAIEMRWRTWKDLHPETLVVSGLQPRGRDYENYPYGDYEVVDNPQTLFPNPEFDTRRPPKERILGIPRDNGFGMAFPFSVLESRGDVVVVHDDVQGTRPVVVFWSTRAQAAVAYHPRSGSRDLTFEARDGGFFDVQTDSRWSLEGRAVAGPLEGAALAPVADAYVAFWFAWATFHPNTDVLSGPLRVS